MIETDAEAYALCCLLGFITAVVIVLSIGAISQMLCIGG